MASAATLLQPILPTLQKQSGTVSAAQALTILTKREWTTLRDSALLHPLPYNVYGLTTTPTSWLQKVWVAVLRFDSSVVASVSAARLYGLIHFAKTPTIVLALPPNASSHCEPNLVLHRTRLYDAPGFHSVHESGLPITTPAQTVVELAKTLPFSKLQQCYRALVHRTLLTRSELSAHLQLLPQTGIKGRKRVLALLEDEHSEAFESQFELRAFEMLVSSGLEPPTPQHPIITPKSTYRADLAYPKSKLCIELDGPMHDSLESSAKDRKRDAALLAAGWKTLRFSRLDDLTELPFRVRAALEGLHKFGS